MNSEREIVKRLMESRNVNEDASLLPDDEESIIRGEHHPISTADRPNISEGCDEDLDEKTYTVGDTQYWRRSGKCYKWTSSGGRSECSEDEYMKAISGGKSEPVKPTEPSKDASKKPPKKKDIALTSNFDKKYMKALSDNGVGPMNHKMGDKFKTPTGVDASIKGFYVDMLGKPKVRLEYEEDGKPQTMDYFADEFKKDVSNGTFVPDSGKPEGDVTDSAYINYDGVDDFDYTTWLVNGKETTIEPYGDGYYLQDEDQDMEFKTKGDLVRYLRDEGAEFQGSDSESDY